MRTFFLLLQNFWGMFIWSRSKSCIGRKVRTFFYVLTFRTQPYAYVYFMLRPSVRTYGEYALTFEPYWKSVCVIYCISIGLIYVEKLSFPDYALVCDVYYSFLNNCHPNYEIPVHTLLLIPFLFIISSCERICLLRVYFDWKTILTQLCFAIWSVNEATTQKHI